MNRSFDENSIKEESQELNYMIQRMRREPVEILWRSNEFQLLLPVPTDPWPCSNPTIETHWRTQHVRRMIREHQSQKSFMLYERMWRQETKLKHT